MGTRADFYIRTPEGLAWQASVAYDGYDVEEMTEQNARKTKRNKSCWNLRHAKNETDFKAALATYLSHRDDATVTDDGWPWPWKDSCTTDRAYVFENGGVRCFAWGKEIVPGNDDAEGPMPEGGWPDMTSIQNVTLGPRSGVMILKAMK